MAEEQLAPIPDDAPEGFPADPDAQLAWVITELIQEHAARVTKGNIEELVDLANWVARAMSGTTFGPLDFTPVQREREAATATSCLTCLQCSDNRSTCTSGYTICKQQYDACVRCPCIT
jgi:hypothetical protein